MNKFTKSSNFPLHTSNIFITLSISVALLINWLPWNGLLATLRPDFVALILLYWCTYQPHRVGIGIAWFLGVLVDVGDASLFGQHALAYSVMAFAAVVLHRRTQMFDLNQQALQILPILVLSYLIYALLHWQLHEFLTWTYFIGCLITALLWIPLSLTLQALQLTRADSDAL